MEKMNHKRGFTDALALRFLPSCTFPLVSLSCLYIFGNAKSLPKTMVKHNQFGILMRDKSS